MSDGVQEHATAQPHVAVCEPVPKQSVALGAFLLCSGLGFLLYAILHFTGHINREKHGAVSDRTCQGTVLALDISWFRQVEELHCPQGWACVALTILTLTPGA